MVKVYSATGLDEWYHSHRQLGAGLGVMTILLLAIVVPVAVYRSIAATGATSFETENASISSSITIGNDTNASGGKYIQFNAASTGGGGTAGTGGQDTGCVFKTVTNPQIAFCDSFNVPQNGGTQTGDLDPQLWGVSRMGNVNVNQGGMLNSSVAAHNTCSGGGVTGNPVTGDTNSVPFGTATPPAKDVQICGGQMAEALNDGHGVVNIDTYPKQPFDWSGGRTGTISFDLSMNSDGTHGAWPELIITDEPVPGARFSVSGGVPAHAVNEVGITFDGCGGGCVGRVYLSKNSSYSLAANSADLSNDVIDSTAVLSNDGSVREAAITPAIGMALNHVEVRLSQNALEVWASDPGGANFKKIAHVTNLGLTAAFTKGLVWMSDTHYNARKAIAPCECGTQYDHTFMWDNLGFDGPKTYRDLGYDVPYAQKATDQPAGQGADGTSDAWILGYRLNGNQTNTYSLPNVTWKQTPQKVKVVLNTVTYDDNSSLTVYANGHSAAPSAVTKPITSWSDYAISFELPVGDVVQGTNTLSFKSTNGSFLITNMSLILVAGASVP